MGNLEILKKKEEEENEVEENENALKIKLYPNKKPRYTFDKEPVKNIIPKDALGHSLDPKQELAYMDSNVPLLNGFYIAYTNHYPIRIKPDDIWLLIVQAFSNHVNANSEELRHHFVNFDGKKKLIVKYGFKDIKQVDKKILEDFSEQINKQMKEFLGEKLVDLLTPNFSTTTYYTKIVGKISIMGAFKKYFDYEMLLSGCGIPYIILEGTAQDYKDIITKAKELSKYDFDWYIDRIIPHIEKMVEAKEGKVDVDYFKNMIQKKEITEAEHGNSGRKRRQVKYDYISGWFLNFFAYLNTDGEPYPFKSDKMLVKDFKKFASQMIVVPFVIIDSRKKKYEMKYKVGFVGCEQNERNQVYPVQGWFVSPITQEEKDSKL